MILLELVKMDELFDKLYEVGNVFLKDNLELDFEEIG